MCMFVIGRKGKVNYDYDCDNDYDDNDSSHERIMIFVHYLCLIKSVKLSVCHSSLWDL